MEADPVVTCRACGCSWYSPTMAHGLEILGRCPRCDGELEFHTPAAVPHDDPGPIADRPPAKALGLPRPPDR